MSDPTVWVVEPENIHAFGALDAFHVLALIIIGCLAVAFVYFLKRNGKNGVNGKTTRYMTNHDLSDIHGKIEDTEDKLRGEMTSGHDAIRSELTDLGKQVTKVEAGQEHMQKSLDRIAHALGPRAVAGD